MKPTSMAALETWNRSWWGELRDEEPTVAEVFSDAGYHTFWIGHNFKSAFTRTILGFQQGFAFVDLVADSGEDPDVDAEIARRAIAHFKQVRGDDRRFFGWVFFGSPHAPYLVHDAGAPAATDEQRYRQELRYMDTQLERTLQALEDEGLQERTIVVFMGDHGEEFREHGGTLHKSTVYTESVHVPLVVWLPWLEQGMRVEAPISTAHVLPWLFQWARSPAFGQFVDARLRQTIGPLLRETEGAVVVELIGHDRMKSSLVYEGYKINYDFATKLYELYAVTEDPMEQTNLFRSRPDLAREYEARFERYLRLRAEKQRFILEPKKKPDEDEPR
jgi:arylsulfatase A-like enzyme